MGDVVLTLRDTRSIMAGIDEDHLYPVKSRKDEAYGAPDDLMNGDYVVSMDGKATDEISCWIRSDTPLPLTVLGVSRDIIVNG